MMIAIVDYGVGNLGSVANMVKKVGGQARITDDPHEILQARALILPGVGSFDTGARNLRERNLEACLRECALEKRIPILGICLGFQLMARASEEGSEPGLGWLAGDVRKLAGTSLPLPHMGWNELQLGQPCEIFESLGKSPRYYFVHSYQVVLDDPQQVCAWSSYGQPICAAARQGNLFGTQFHPEKSHRFGVGLMRNFLRLAYAP